MTADDLAARLERVRYSGPGFTARCPAHEDRSPSLSVRDGEKGVLVHCHAGCSVEDVCSAINIQPSDLFPESSQRVTDSDINLLLRQTIRDTEPYLKPAETLGEVIKVTFTGTDEDYERIEEQSYEMLELPFKEAMHMWFPVADGIVFEYLKPWFMSLPYNQRDWFEVRRNAMKKLSDTYRKQHHFV